MIFMWNKCWWLCSQTNSMTVHTNRWMKCYQFSKCLNMAIYLFIWKINSPNVYWYAFQRLLNFFHENEHCNYYNDYYNDFTEIIWLLISSERDSDMYFWSCFYRQSNMYLQIEVETLKKYPMNILGLSLVNKTSKIEFLGNF